MIPKRFMFYLFFLDIPLVSLLYRYYDSVPEGIWKIVLRYYNKKQRTNEKWNKFHLLTSLLPIIFTSQHNELVDLSIDNDIQLISYREKTYERHEHLKNDIRNNRWARSTSVLHQSTLSIKTCVPIVLYTQIHITHTWRCLSSRSVTLLEVTDD